MDQTEVFQPASKQEVDELRQLITELQAEVDQLRFKKKILKKRSPGELTGVAKLAYQAVRRGLITEGLDLLNTKRLIFVLRQQFPDEEILEMSYVPRELNRMLRSIGTSFGSVPGFTSLRTTTYAPGDHIEKGRQINSTVWCIRNLENYQHMTPSQLAIEEEAQWNLTVHGEANPEPTPLSQAPLTFF